MSGRRSAVLTAMVGLGLVLGLAQPSHAFWPFKKRARERGIYASAAYGTPVMVPVGRVTREYYTYSWGVPSSSIRRIQSQYSSRGCPCHRDICVVCPTPPMVTSTDQLGYYYGQVP